MSRLAMARILSGVRRPAVALTFAVALAVAGGIEAWAKAEGLPPRRQVLKTEQELGDVLPLDVNGDGLLDLVVLELDRSRRDGPVRARVFVQTPEGFVPPSGPGDLLPDGVVLAGAGHFVQGPGLALLTAEGVAVWIWQGDRFVPNASLPLEGLFPWPGARLQTGLTWVADLKGDGRSELLVPRPDGVLLLTQNGSGEWRSGGLLRTRARGQLVSLFRRKVASYDLPTLFLLGTNGDAWQEIVAFSDGMLYVFRPDGETVNGGKADGKFPGERSPVLKLDLRPPSPFDPAKPFDPPLLLIAAQDLNGDGLLDLVFTKTQAGDSDFAARTRTLVHYGRAAPGPAGVTFAAEPDQVFDSEGFSLPIVVDLNRDRRADLVLVNVEVGFWTAIRALIARSVTAEAGFYLMSDARQYPRRPDGTEKFSVKFTLGRATHQPIVLFGDLNGDGLPDLLLSVDKDRLGVHFGQADAFWSGTPDGEIADKLPIRPDRVRVVDLNGDGRDDLIFLYGRDDIRAMPETNRSVTVLMSRYGPPPVHPAPRTKPAPDASPPPRRVAELFPGRTR